MNDTDNVFKQWQARPDARTMTPLVKSLEPTIDKALKSYGYSGDPNMKTTAQLHVMKAIPRFDPSKSKINTFVTNELKRLQRLGPKQQHAMPIPEQAAYDLKSVQNIETELMADLGRDPTGEELADATGLSSKRIRGIKSKYAMPTLTESAFEAPNGDINLPGIDDNDEQERLWAEAVYSGLDPIDKKIMDWSMGWHGADRTSKTVMAQKLGVSIPAITQRAQRVAGKLAEGSEYKLI